MGEQPLDLFQMLVVRVPLAVKLLAAGLAGVPPLDLLLGHAFLILQLFLEFGLTLLLELSFLGAQRSARLRELFEHLRASSRTSLGLGLFLCFLRSLGFGYRLLLGALATRIGGLLCPNRRSTNPKPRADCDAEQQDQAKRKPVTSQPRLSGRRHREGDQISRNLFLRHLDCVKNGP